MRPIFASAKVDFLRKTRRQSFLLCLLFMAILAMIFFPNDNAAYQTIVLGEFRGIYNSAWIGNTLAILNVSFFPLILFYYLRGGIQEDVNSNCVDLFAASKLTKTQYLMGKSASNFAIGLCILLWMICIAVFMQLWIGEDRAVSLVAIVLPQLIHTVPILLLISALCVLFDSIRVLQSGLGNVLYFFIATIGMATLNYQYLGVNAVVDEMKENVYQLYGVSVDSITIGISAKQGPESLQTFVWEGANYTLASFQYLLIALAISGACILIAAISFNFNRQLKTGLNHNKQGILEKLVAAIVSPFKNILVRVCSSNVFLNITRQELYILVGRHSVYLYFCLLVLWCLQIMLPHNLLTQAVLPITVLLNALIISQLGQREHSYNTLELLCNKTNIMKLQFPAMYVAALFWLIITSLPALIRLCIDFDGFALSLIFSAYICIIALAICLGTSSKTSRAFEIVFVLVWYMGPMSQFTYLDFIGVDIEQSKALNTNLIFTAVALILVGLSIVLRKRSLRYA